MSIPIYDGMEFGNAHNSFFQDYHGTIRFFSSKNLWLWRMKQTPMRSFYDNMAQNTFTSCDLVYHDLCWSIAQQLIIGKENSYEMS